MLAKTVSSGIITERATILGRTRNSIGGMPSVCSAEISSLTCMVPRLAAKAAPVRPDIRIAVIIAPISRTIAMPTRLATKIAAPNC